MNRIQWDHLSPARVEVDPNMRTPEGFTPAFARELPSSIAVGDAVVVFEPEDGTLALARVARLKGPVVLLAVEWATLRDAMVPITGGNSAANTTTSPVELVAA